MLVLTAGEFEDRWAGTSLANSCFAWGRGTRALALGSGSLSNHSFRPNARYDEVGPQTREFTAVRDIAPCEEITVNYQRPAKGLKLPEKSSHLRRLVLSAFERG